MNKFHIYLHFPTEDIENHIHSEADAQQYINDISILIDRADCEKGVALYYEGANKDNFVANLAVIADLGSFDLLTPETTLNILLQYAENWEETSQLARNDFIHKVWDLDAQQVIGDFPPILKEICEKQTTLPENETSLYLNIAHSFPFRRAYVAAPFIPIIKDSNDIFPQLINIECVTDFEGLEKWLTEKRQSRLLNTTDPRHQENNPAYISGKSPLLYDLRIVENQSHLSELLKTAISDQREREQISKDLINYDSQKDRYIWFENENAHNRYHCYHIAYTRHHTQPHGRDIQQEVKIPERVKAILAYRRNRT